MLRCGGGDAGCAAEGVQRGVTARRAAAQVVPPAPELHAARLYDPALPAAEELSRLNRALLAAFTQLLGYAPPAACGLQPC